MSVHDIALPIIIVATIGIAAMLAANTQKIFGSFFVAIFACVILFLCFLQISWIIYGPRSAMMVPVDELFSRAGAAIQSGFFAGLIASLMGLFIRWWRRKRRSRAS